MVSGPLVLARGVRKAYGPHAVLDGLDLSIERGERVAVLGLNGAGKTTLFRCLLGLVEFEGTLEVDGHPAGPAGKAARARIGYVPQQPPRFDLALDEFVDLFGTLRGLDRDRVEAGLEELGLSLREHGGKGLRDLSGGMLQKALLAVALAGRAPVLLLDEPTANLDPASRRDFLRALERVGRETTLLFASHRLDDVESLADRLLLLHRGRFAFDGPAAELRGVGRGGGRVWVQVPRDEKEALARTLEGCAAVREVRDRGAGLELSIETDRRGRVLAEIEGRGFTLLDFRTRAPALEEVMRRLAAGDGDR